MDDDRGTEPRIEAGKVRLRDRSVTACLLGDLAGPVLKPGVKGSAVSFTAGQKSPN